MSSRLRIPALPDRVVGVVAGSLGILVTVGVLWFLYAVLYTPTTTLYVLDDLNPNAHDPNGACAPYAGTVITLSTMTADSCGD